MAPQHLALRHSTERHSLSTFVNAFVSQISWHCSIRRSAEWHTDKCRGANNFEDSLF